MAVTDWLWEQQKDREMKTEDPETLKPLHDGVLVRMPPPEKVSAGGIIIPDSAEEKPMQGTAVAVGSKCREVVPGRTVYFRRFAGVPLMDTDEYRIMKESEILAVRD